MFFQLVILIWNVQRCMALLNNDHQLLRWTYNFKPLIGGPSWLPIHVSTRIFLVDAHGNEIGTFLLDFIPKEPTESLPLLLSGKSVSGKFRMVFDNETRDALFALELLEKCFERCPRLSKSKNLNLVSFNCYTFAWILNKVLCNEY